VYDLRCAEIIRTHAFNGQRDLTPRHLAELLGLEHFLNVAAGAGAGQARVVADNRFLCPLSQCDYVLSNIIEDLLPDPFPVPDLQRPIRRTGAALSIALSLLEVIPRCSALSASDDGRIWAVGEGCFTASRAPGIVGRVGRVELRW